MAIDPIMMAMRVEAWLMATPTGWHHQGWSSWSPPRLPNSERIKRQEIERRSNARVERAQTEALAALGVHLGLTDQLITQSFA